jgi:putative ABC transport system permease protein
MSTVALAWEPITIEGYVSQTTQESIVSNVRIVSPGYLQTMKLQLAKGRFFDERDVNGAAETVIVDEALAERFWHGEEPLGKRLHPGKSGAWKTVVGVIRNTREFSLEKEPPITVYYPFEQYGTRNMHLLVRTTSDPLPMTQSIIGAIQSLDAELPVFDVKTMDQRLYEALARRRFAMLLLGGFAMIALLLAGIGIYGVMAYSVNQRTHEIGIRLALGAQTINILRLIIRQALLLVVIGIAFGLTGALALSRVISSLLFGVSTTDWFTFAVTSLLLGGIALLASYVPARRATKVDPMVALRYE